MSHVVVKLAGINGSGKTTLAREVMDRFDMNVVEKSPTGRPLAYRGRARSSVSYLKLSPLYLVVLGPYAAVCGGMDGINNQVEKMRLLRKYAVPGNLVLFEGILTGVTYGEMGVMSEEPAQKGKWLYAFMGTPYAECVRRVESRRYAAYAAKVYAAETKGAEKLPQLKPFDPTRSMEPKVRAIKSVSLRAVEAGHRVVVIEPSTPELQAKFLLKEAAKLL